MDRLDLCTVPRKVAIVVNKWHYTPSLLLQLKVLKLGSLLVYYLPTIMRGFMASLHLVLLYEPHRHIFDLPENA